MDDSCIRNKKVAFSNENGYAWSEPNNIMIVKIFYDCEHCNDYKYHSFNNIRIVEILMVIKIVKIVNTVVSIIPDL